MNKNIYLTLKKVINELISKESAHLSKKIPVVLNKNSSFMDSPEVDSLLTLEIISRIEKAFGIQLTEEDFIHFDTMENIANLIEIKIKEKDSPSQSAKITKPKIDYSSKNRVSRTKHFHRPS